MGKAILRGKKPFSRKRVCPPKKSNICYISVLVVLYFGRAFIVEDGSVLLKCTVVASDVAFHY